LSTHILPEVDQVCERVFIIDQGKIVADGTPDALRTRLVGNPAVHVELKGAGAEAVEKLAKLPGVTEVDAEHESGSFRIRHENGSDPREEIFHLAVAEKWIMRGMAPERATLEDVFVRLTTSEAAEEV
jgi:ABC-2 type transport system ATP-binding protein